MVKNQDKIPLVTTDTFKSGPFKFQVAVDDMAIDPLLDRVQDAHQRFHSIPMLPSLAKTVQREVVISSIFGTNTIEGGTLSLTETAGVLDQQITPEEAKEDKERRVLNIRKAYELVEKAVKHFSKEAQLVDGRIGVVILLEEANIKNLHKTITEGLIHPRNTPGKYRNNIKSHLTKVGNADHGGVYVPPKCLDDINLLMTEFLRWINLSAWNEVNPLIRASLCHYYFERIHPFWDGNGRVGRVLEALILRCSGFAYAPFALARSYLTNIDEYFTVFNLSRRAEEKGEDFPNTNFVKFFLERMLETINHLHDTINDMIGYILYDNIVANMIQTKTINHRQFTIIQNLKSKGLVHDIESVQKEIWYTSLYSDLTRRTRDRDLKGLIDKNLVQMTDEKKIKLNVPSH